MPWNSTRPSRAKPIRGWSYYLIAAAVLAPLVVPNGPGQIAILDVVNAAALLVFAIWAVMNGRALKLPFAFPMLLIMIGSLFATVNAESVTHALMTVAQDIYLYLWFVLIVNVIDTPTDLKRLRIAWLWAAVAVAIIGVILVVRMDPSALSKLIGLKGARAEATFYNPNMYADYLVLSLFIAMSLAGQVRGAVLWGAAAVMLFGLVTTKSNGGLVMLVVGLMAWAVTRALTRNRSMTRLLGMGMLFLGLGVFAWWLSAGWGVGTKSISAIGEGSFLGRVTKSSEVRLQIWSELGERYARFPLGIGPGNSQGATALDRGSEPAGVLHVQGSAQRLCRLSDRARSRRAAGTSGAHGGGAGPGDRHLEPRAGRVVAFGGRRNLRGRGGRSPGGDLGPFLHDRKAALPALLALPRGAVVLLGGDGQCAPPRGGEPLMRSPLATSDLAAAHPQRPGLQEAYGAQPGDETTFSPGLVPVDHSVRLVEIINLSSSAKTLLKDRVLAMRARGLDNRIICIDGPHVRSLRDLGIPVHTVHLPRGHNPIRALQALFEIMSYLRKERIHLVHTHCSVPGFIGRLAARLAGVPVVMHTVHGFHFHERSAAWDRNFYLGLERFAGGLTDQLLSQNRADLEEARRHRMVPEDRLQYIGNGIDLDHFQAASPVAREDGVVTITCVARFEPVKNHRMLIDAIRIMKEQGSRIRLWLVGNGPQRGECEKWCAESGVDDVVQFLGYREDMPALLAQTDIAVLSSVKEGIPRSVLEAMGMEIPVVATRVIGTEEAVRDGETGFLVELGDARAMAAAMMRLAADPSLRRKLGRRGREVALANFNESAIVEALIDIYRNQLSSKGIRGSWPPATSVRA